MGCWDVCMKEWPKNDPPVLSGRKKSPTVNLWSGLNRRAQGLIPLTHRSCADDLASVSKAEVTQSPVDAYLQRGLTPSFPTAGWEVLSENWNDVAADGLLSTKTIRKGNKNTGQIRGPVRPELKRALPEIKHNPSCMHWRETLYERAKPRLWSDHELNLLHKGVQEYGYRRAMIRDALLPHRTVQKLHERYWRSQAKRAGRFTEKERSLLETAITTFGEDANWNFIASQVPGRTGSQCRNSWNHGRTHHLQRQDEPWTEEDRHRLKRAVERFGAKKWTLGDGSIDGTCGDANELKEEEAKVRMLMLIAQRGTDGTNMEDGANKFERYVPRFKGKGKVDWKEVAKGMEGRTYTSAM
ncbi:MAG: hypothetical protein J3Q66DRAFT_429908 [Benniella sp.]|nr:MAG: hypothetical protein J3Q66DRAFT_429908 [Benniella sp.]